MWFRPQTYVSSYSKNKDLSELTDWFTAFVERKGSFKRYIHSRRSQGRPFKEHCGGSVWIASDWNDLRAGTAITDMQ